MFVDPALPRVLWIAEVHLDVGGEAEALVRSHLLAPVPGQRSIELVWQVLGLQDQGRYRGAGVPVGGLDPHHVPGLALLQRSDLEGRVAKRLVTFPMHGTARSSTVARRSLIETVSGTCPWMPVFCV